MTSTHNRNKIGPNLMRDEPPMAPTTGLTIFPSHNSDTTVDFAGDSHHLSF